ncbi:MAG: hypothetical protein U0V75_03345 [Ferruginibacter sp.]
MKKNRQPLLFISAWLVAGTLDILGAIFILGNGHATATFKYIAAAVTGKDAIPAATYAVLLGAVFHYLVALCWTAAYFLLYKRTRFDKIPVIFSALLTGCIIFFSMRYIFVPLLGQLPAPKPIDSTQVNAILKNILILTLAFGTCLKYFAARFYKQVT